MSEAPRVLVTGAAGFIGFHLARRLLAELAVLFLLVLVPDIVLVPLKWWMH